MSLNSKAVLVELNISSWSGRKLDRKVSAETNVAKGARSDVARVNKNLFAGSDKLEKINNFVSSVRQEFYTMTLPWSISGARMLPVAQFFDYRKWVSEKEQEFDAMVAAFLIEYSSLISAQAFRLGTMFDKGEYPDVGELKNKFRFQQVMTPVPESGDFRIDAVNQEAEELKKELESQYAKASEERINGAVGDLWGRIYKTVQHLRDKCAMEKTVFYERTLENALELCSLLTRLNVTGDKDLEDRRVELEKALCGVTREGLAKDVGVRNDTKAKMDAMLAKMAGVGL